MSTAEVLREETTVADVLAAGHVYWLEQNEEQVAAGDQWLSPRERLSLSGLRFAKRRNDWLMGRWTAKRAVAACLDLPLDTHVLAEIEIRAALSGAPEVFLCNQTAALTISLSHRAGVAMCVIAPSGTSVGCDLETVEPRSHAFIADYFTVNERTLVERTPAGEQPLMVALIWSAKESVLKALRVGLRLDTARVDVNLGATLLRQNGESRRAASLREADGVDGWSPLRAFFDNDRIYQGWWYAVDDLVRTVVSSSRLYLPVPLISAPPREFMPLSRRA